MKLFKNILSAVASAKAENRQKALMVAVLCFAFAFSATATFAALTLTTTTVSSDGALTLTGAATSTWSLSAGDLTVAADAGAVNLTATGASAGDMTFTVGDDFTLNGVAASIYAIGAATTTGNITIGGTSQTSGVTTILGGTGTGALGSATSGIALTPGVAGTVNIGSTTGIGAITVGASTGAGQTVTVGGGDTTGSDIVNVGTGTATTRKTVNIATGAISTTNIGTGNFVNTIHIGDHATPVNIITIGGANSGTTLGGTLASSRTLTSQTTENNNFDLSLTTDSTFLTGTDITYSGGRGSSALKLTGTFSGVDGGGSNLYSLATNTGAHTAATGGVVGIKGVTVNTAALTDGNIYGGQFIAKHNHATNAMANAAALIGLEGYAYDSAAAPANTLIGANLGYHNEGTVAKSAGSVYRGIQIFTDDAAGSTSADERTSLALWNQAGTQTNGIKFIKSDGGWTTDVTLQNAETIGNATNGVVAVGGNLLVNGVRLLTVPATPGSDSPENFFKVTGAITGVGDGTASNNTRGITIDMTRAVSNNTVRGDTQDNGLKINITNKSTANATGYQVRGMDVLARTRDSGNATNVIGGYIAATADNSPGTVANIYGVQANVHSDGTVTGNVAALYANDDSQGASGSMYGVLIDGNGTAPARTASIRVQSTTGSWGYGLDMNGATIGTADIRLKNGNVISNAAAGTISFGAANLTTTGFVLKSFVTGLTAQADATQANATALTSDINVVTTVAGAQDSVKLPTAVAGMEITVINRTATAMDVFGQTGADINGAGANLAYAVAGNVTAKCFAIDSTTWECQKMSR